jgi:hypothetical protein
VWGGGEVVMGNRTIVCVCGHLILRTERGWVMVDELVGSELWGCSVACGLWRGVLEVLSDGSK